MRCDGGNDLASPARKRPIAANIHGRSSRQERRPPWSSNSKAKSSPVSEDDEGMTPSTPVETEQDQRPPADDDWED